MLHELNKQLAELKEQDRLRAKLRYRLQQVQADLHTERAGKDALEKSLAKETADVEKLEGLSLTAIFHTILGSKDLQLHREKQEQLAAQLKYDESAATVQDLEQEQQQLQAELQAFNDLDNDLKAVLAAKEAALLAENDETSLRLNSMAEEISKLQASTREVEEAVQAGSLVLTAVEHVVAALEGAKNWGTWDMFGGGMMVTMMKHGKIDEAKAAMHQVQQRLRQFNYELKDVNRHEGLSINIDGFDTFSDYFLDSLIFDWIVQSKIEKSLNNALQLGNKIVGVVNNLRTNLHDVQRQLEEVRSSRRLLIQNAGAAS